MDNELEEIAVYIKKEMEKYFSIYPRMLYILKRIKIVNYSDKTVLEIPEEIYNVSCVTDKKLIEKCIKKGINKYMMENNMIGSVK